MKKTFLTMAALALVAAGHAQQAHEYDLVVLTFEDADYKGTGNVAGGDSEHGWSTLIDSEQYGGELLFGADSENYRWLDENNTWLTGGVGPTGAYGPGFWNGGTAVSNHVMHDFKGATYTEQLSAYNPEAGGKGGRNGSDNFLVCYGNDDGSAWGVDNRPVIAFAEGAFVIDHAYVNLSAYGLSVAYYGDGFGALPAADDDWVDITAEALDASGLPTGKSVVYRAIDGKANILQTWQKWDLHELGECAAVRFNVASSMAGDYGMNFPAYFLLDDIAVRVNSGSAVDAPCGADGAATAYGINGIKASKPSGKGLFITNGLKRLAR